MIALNETVPPFVGAGTVDASCFVRAVGSCVSKVCASLALQQLGTRNVTLARVVAGLKVQAQRYSCVCGFRGGEVDLEG